MYFKINSKYGYLSALFQKKYYKNDKLSFIQKQKMNQFYISGKKWKFYKEIKDKILELIKKIW